MNSNGHPYDAIVVGAGPAGSAAATVLAMNGRRIVVLEREKFPRYHIGESMLPYCYFTLARLGMVEKMQKSHYPKKYSVQFVSENGKASTPFYFHKHLDHPAAQTWQVVRSEFDHLLMNNAREKGVEVLEETTVRELIQEDDAIRGVRAHAKDGSTKEFRAPITIDASGRDALAVTRNRWKVRDPYLNKIALWTYYKGAVRDPGVDEGATTVAYVPEKGWFWYIPWPNDIVSVGIVAEKDYLFNGSTRDLGEIFQREVKNNKWIEDHLAPGMRCDDYRTTAEYSYRSEYCAANGLILCGDAFAFLDPVFSSGVFLALRSGEMAGDAVEAALQAKDYSASQFAGYGSHLCKSIEGMRKLVYAFYDHNFSFRDLIKAHPTVRPALTDCLIGHLTRDFEALYTNVAEFAKIPPELAHGHPLVEAR